MKHPSREQLAVAFVYLTNQINILGNELIRALNQMPPYERPFLKYVVEEYRRTCNDLDHMMNSWPDAPSQENHGI